MDHLDLAPITRTAGTVKLPGSKSISNRALLLAALAEGSSRLHGVLDAHDTRVMVTGLRRLGIGIDAEGGDTFRVQGAGGVFPVKQAELVLGNAGTAFRPLTAALALADGEYKLSGTARMHERPIADLVDALVPLGANIEYLGRPGFPPLQIRPRAQSATLHTAVRGDVSSQFLSALLMAAPLTGMRTVIEVEGELISKPYVEITLDAMRRFGVEAARAGAADTTYAIPAASRYRAIADFRVEGDASSASYFLAAGAISGLRGGGPVRVQGVGRDSVQGDVKFAEVLRAMGARVDMGEDWLEAGAEGAAAAGGKFKAVDADLNAIPDAAMTVAMCALFADGPSTLRNIGSWRVKETDRLTAMSAELRKLGAQAETGDDWLRVTPPVQWRSASIDTYDDHRMAMCFSLAALGGVMVRINDPGCVAKTFPDYFTVLAGISETA